MESFSSRLERFITTTNLNVTDFERHCGIGKTVVQKVLKDRNRKLSIDALELIKIKYPELNLDWLLLNQGEMFLTNKKATYVSETELSTVNEQQIDLQLKNADKDISTNALFLKMVGLVEKLANENILVRQENQELKSQIKPPYEEHGS